MINFSGKIKIRFLGTKQIIFSFLCSGPDLYPQEAHHCTMVTLKVSFFPKVSYI